MKWRKNENCIDNPLLALQKNWIFDLYFGNFWRTFRKFSRYFQNPLPDFDPRVKAWKPLMVDAQNQRLQPFESLFYNPLGVLVHCREVSLYNTRNCKLLYCQLLYFRNLIVDKKRDTSQLQLTYDVIFTFDVIYFAFFPILKYIFYQ